MKSLALISWALVWVCAVAIWPAGALASEWPRFRGPDGAGLSTGTNLPVRWTEGDYAWKTGLPGKGHSSPVTWGDLLFLTSGNVTNADRYIVALAQKDGKEVWRRKYSSEVFTQHRENSYGTSTPAVDANGVYVYWTTPEVITVAAFSLDGGEKWIRQLGPFKGNHGSGASPVVCRELVWINNDQDGPSSLIALDAKTGEVRHTIERRTDKVAYGTPCTWQRPGRGEELIFAASSHGLTGVDGASGEVTWELTNLFSARIVGSPIVSQGLAICTSGEGGTGRRLVAVRPGGDNNPAELGYELKRDIPYVPTPLAANGLLFLLGDNGLLRCVRAGTGEPLWQERLGARFYASPIWADGRLYLTGTEGEVLVVRAADKYELLARNALKEPTFATPAVANGTLFFRTESSVIALRGNPVCP